MDLWDELRFFASRGRPLLCYGMGDGADKLFAVLEDRGLTVADTFASDGFVRGQLFHGRRVLSYSEAIAKYDDPVILIAFGSSRREVLDAVLRLNAVHTVRVPELPVTVEPGERITPFDADFFASHREEIARAEALFEEERSRALYRRMLAFRLGGRWEDLMADTSPADAQYSLFEADYGFILDLGGYCGDSARYYLSRFPNAVILSAEPDPGSFRRLEKFALSEGGGRVIPLRAAAWDRRETLMFSAKGNRNSSLLSGGSGAVGVTAEALPPDEMAGERRVGLIKYDVEGAEARALMGSRELFSRDAPDLLLSLYHRKEDIFALPLLLDRLLRESGAGAYRFFLRREPGFPGWDLNLIAKKIAR